MAEDIPPGWLPVNRLDVLPAWSDFRKIDDKVHLHLPKNVSTVRGVFACFVFHSQDPRELADLWEFAMVTVPWPFEDDLGHNDKRNGRYQLGHPQGDMGVFLRYLEVAAKETNHPELASAPIVGWLMRNGPRLAGDLYRRAPERVLAWSDGLPNHVAEQAPWKLDGVKLERGLHVLIAVGVKSDGARTSSRPALLTVQ